MQLQEERIIFISMVLSRPETLPPSAAAQQQQQEGDVHLGFWYVLSQSNHLHAMAAATSREQAICHCVC